MRIIHHLKWNLVTNAVILLFGLAIAANAEPVPQVIQVLQLKGQARYSNDNKTWSSLRKGDILQPGILIQTAAKSALDLQLSEQFAAPVSIDGPHGALRSPDELKANTIRLYENSVLDIGKLTCDRAATREVLETQLDLRAGRMMGGVREASTTSRYEIKFLKGVAGVRKGVYLMNSSGEVSVLYGATVIALEVADGSTPVKIVAANHQFDPGTGLVTEISSPVPVEPLAADSKSAATTAASHNAPPFPGQGMGGALRKF